MCWETGSYEGLPTALNPPKPPISSIHQLSVLFTSIQNNPSIKP